MTRIPDARFVKEKLELTRGVGAMAAMQEFLTKRFAGDPDAFTFLRLMAVESGWLAEVVWDHHDGEIIEFSAVKPQPWTAMYKVCADYLKTDGRPKPDVTLAINLGDSLSVF